MKQFIATTVICALALSICGTAFAHGGEHRTLFGTITAVSENSMTVSTSDQKSEIVELSPSTSYVIVNGGDGRQGDLREGTRVVVKLNAHGLVADEVRYASAPEKAMPGEQHHGMAGEHEKGHEHHHKDGAHD